MSGVGGHVVVGTPAYLSPEAHNHQRANPSFDLWALAVTFYEVIAGQRPFVASPEELPDLIQSGRWTPIEQHVPTAPLSLVTFFGTSFAHDIADRPRDVHQLDRRLRSIRGSIPA